MTTKHTSFHDRPASYWFRFTTLPDGTDSMVLSEATPDWVREAVETSHQGELTNPWRMNACYRIVRIMEKMAESGPINWDTATARIASECGDSDPQALKQWLADDPRRIGLMQDWSNGYGQDDPNLSEKIAGGQRMALYWMMTMLALAINTHRPMQLQQLQ